MKEKLCLLLVGVWLAVYGCGCSTRSITYGNATYKSVRLGSKEDINSLSIQTDTNGATRIKLEGYKNDQVQAMSAVVEAAVKAAVGR